MGINFPTVDDKAMYPRAKMKATFDQLWPSLFSMTQELEGVKIKGVNVIPKVILRKLTKDQIARLSNTVRIRRPGPRSRRFRKAVITSDSDSDGGSLPDSGEPTNFSYFSDDDDDEAEAALQNPSSRFGPSKENVGKEAVPKLNNEKNTSKSSDKVDQEILMRVTNLKDKEFLYNTDESSPNPVNSFIKALAEGTNSFSKSSERVHQKRNVNFDKAFDRVHREVISTGKGGHESRKESVLSSNKLNEKWASSSKSASTTHQAKEVWKKPLPKNDKSSPGNNSKENAVKASKTRSLSSANKLASQHSTTSSKSNNNLSGDKVSTSESTSKDVARTKLGNSSSTEAKEKHVSELKTKDGLKEMLDTKPRISEKRKSSEDETVFSHSEDKKGKKRKLSPARKAPPPNMVSVPSATIIEYVGLGKEIQIKKNLELSRGLKQPNVPKLKISTEPELRVSTEPALKASKEPALKASKEPALKALKEATLKASEEPAPKISTEPTLTISAASKSKASAEPPKVVIKEVVKKDDSLVSLPIMLVINTEEEKLSKETLDMKSIEDMKHVARTLSNILCKLKKHKLEVERELDDEVKKLKKKYDAKVEDVETNIKLYNEIDIELCSEIPKMYPGNELKTLNEELKSKIKDLFIHDMGEEEEQELKESTEDEVLTRTGQDFSHNTLTKSSRNNTSETRRSSSEGEVTLNSLYPKKTNDKDVVLLTPFRNKPCNFVSQLSKSSQSACTSLKHDLTLVHYVENSSPTYNLRSESNANKSVKGMSNDQNSDDKAFEKYSSLKKLADSLSRPSINTVVTLKKQPKKPLTLSGTENNTDTHSNKANASSEFSERAQIPTDSVTTMQGNVPKSSQPTLVSTIKDLNVKDRSVREETRAQQSQSKESANPKQAIIRTIPEANVEYFGQKTKETKGAANVQHSTDVSRSKETSHQKPNESFGAKVQSPSLTMGTRVGHEVTLSKAQPTLRVDQTPIRHNSVSNPVSSSVIHIGPSTPTNSGVIHVRPSTPTNSGVIHVRPSAPTSSGVIHVRPSTPTSSTITPLRQHRAIASKQPILNPTTSVQTSHYTAIKPMSTMTSARPIQQHVSISPIVSHITNAQHIPNTQPQHIPNAQPQHIPNAQPQHITNAQPQHIPNTQQQHIPNTQQQQISNVLPQAAHVQPQQVGQVPVQSHLALLQPHIGNIQPQLQVSRLQSQQLLITHSQQQIPQLQQVSQIQTSQPQQQFPLLLQQQPPSYHQAINQQQPQHQTYQISTQQQQQQQQQQHQTYQINTQPQQQLQQQQQPQLQQQQQQQQQQQPVYQQQSTYQPQMQYSHQYQISSNLTPQAHVDEHGNVVMKNIPMASKQQDEPQNKNQNSSLLKQILGEKSRPNLSASVQQQPSVSVSNQMFPIITSAISLARGNSPSPDLQTSEDIIDLSAKTCFLCGVEATILCCGQFVYCGPACKESDRDRHKQECRAKN